MTLTNFLFGTFEIIILLLVFLLLYIKWSFTYWSRRGVPTLNPTIPFGDIEPLIKKRESNGELLRRFYNHFKSKGYRFGGVYNSILPIFIPTDVTLVKNILTKDFHHFVNHGNYIDEDLDPLSANLFNLEDDKWKSLRAKLTPTFTASKMKMLHDTLKNCAEALEEILIEYDENKEPLDIKETMSRFTTDCIASCAFGFEAKTLKNPNANIRLYGRRIFENTPYEGLRLLMSFVVPNRVLKICRFKSTKPDVEEYFMGLVKKGIEHREKNKEHRKDFLHLLLQLKNRKMSNEEICDSKENHKDVSLSLRQLMAHCYVFFAAGYETSSTLMTFAIYELTLNPEMQDKVRQEIQEVLGRHHGNLSYEAVQEVKYLDLVLNETLRKYPPAPFLPRVCGKSYRIPNTSVVIERNTTVIIPVFGIHYDPDIYPEPEKFIPERFSEENRSTIPTGAWLPFGEGPRICIGLRFGLFQTKLGLIKVLKGHELILNEEKTFHPVKFDPVSATLSFKGGLWVNVQKT